jgi:N-acetylglutamate synthase-like GNAT family acetyltransferase
MEFPAAHQFLVYQRAGRVSACLGYRIDGDEVRVLHVWAEDGFGGRRGAVELMKSVERSADAEGLDLVFTARASNSGLANAVKWHGCEPSPGEEHGAVIFRRKAAVAS